MSGTWHPTANKWRDESIIIHFVPRGKGGAVCGKGRGRYSETRQNTLGGQVDPEGRQKCQMCEKFMKMKGIT